MQRVRRVPGDDRVGEPPQHRSGDGEGEIASAISPGGRRRHRAPHEVDRRQQPRLRSQQAGEGEQREHERAAARSRDLQRTGPYDERHVGEIEIPLRGEIGEVHPREQQCGGDRPDDRTERQPPEAIETGHERDEAADRPEDHEPVGVVAEDRHERAEGDRQRMLGRRPVDVEYREMQVEHVAPPDEGVVGVVGWVGREQEEPDQRAGADGGKPDLRPGVSGHGPQARQPDGARPRPGERRDFHRAPAAERLGRGSPRLASSRFLWDTGWPVYATPWRSRAGGRPFGPSEAPTPLP